MDDKELKSLETLISKQGLKSWGTNLDFIEKVPPEYMNKTFYEMNHADISKFFNMSNIEKFKMAYWVERLQSKRSAKQGFFFGVILVILIEMIIYNITN